MSEITRESALAHFGVKGMKWGVRRDIQRMKTTRSAAKEARAGVQGGNVLTRGVRKDVAGIKAARATGKAFDKETKAIKTQAKQNRKDDKLFEKGANSPVLAQHIYNKASQDYLSHDAPKIDRIPKFKAAAKNGDLAKNTQVAQEYSAAHAAAFALRLNEAAGSVGTNASGTRKYEVLFTGDLSHWTVRPTDVQHADSPMRVKLVRDSQGFIVDIVPDWMMQASIRRGENALMHMDLSVRVRDI